MHFSNPLSVQCAGLVPTAHSAGAPSSNSSSSEQQLRTFLQNLPATNSTACWDRELQWLKAETFNLTKPAEPCTVTEFGIEAKTRRSDSMQCASAQFAALKAKLNPNKTSNASV